MIGVHPNVEWYCLLMVIPILDQFWNGTLNVQNSTCFQNGTQVFGCLSMEGVIIECPQYGLYHDHCDAIITSRMAVSIYFFRGTFHLCVGVVGVDKWVRSRNSLRQS